MAAPLLKAFWSRTYGEGTFAPPAPDPWFMPLDPTDRNDIVSLTTSRGPGRGAGHRQLLRAHRPRRFDKRPGALVTRPQQRDLARVVDPPHLGRAGTATCGWSTSGTCSPSATAPFKIKVTDREFQVASAPRVGGRSPKSSPYLVTKEYIVVTEPIITYTGDTHEPFSGRGNPLRQVEVKTVTTPPIDFDPSADPGIKVGALGSDTDYVLWVRSGLADVPFSFVSTDLEGRKVDFTASVIWVDLTRTDQSDVDEIISAYDAAGPSRNSPSLGGQLVAFRRHGRGQARGDGPTRRQLHADGQVRCQRRRQLLPSSVFGRGPPAGCRADRGRRVNAAVRPERFDLRQLFEQRLPGRRHRGLPGRKAKRARRSISPSTSWAGWPPRTSV